MTDDRKPPRRATPRELFPEFDQLSPAQRLIEEAAAALEADRTEENWERFQAARELAWRLGRCRVCVLRNGELGTYLLETVQLAIENFGSRGSVGYIVGSIEADWRGERWTPPAQAAAQRHTLRRLVQRLLTTDRPDLQRTLPAVRPPKRRPAKRKPAA